ncbi:CU044_5270 family protein [Streptomyces sp. NPDC002530]
MTHTDQRTDVLDFPGAEALHRAGRTAPPDDAVRERARSLVLAAIAADTAAPAPVPPGRRAHPGRRRVLVGAAAVAVLAAGAALLPVTDIGGEPAATASAAEVFTALADRAATGDGADAPYWHTTVRTWVEGERARTDDTYLSRNAVVIKTHDGRTITKSNPSGTSWAVGDRQVGWKGLAALPTAPDALRRALSAGAKGPAAAEQAVRQAGTLLTDAPAPPRLRAALYRVMAGTPGAEVTEGVKDAAGRTGTRISWTWSGALPLSVRHNPGWIVRPSDALLLETDYSPVNDPGHITNTHTYLHAGPANSTG